MDAVPAVHPQQAGVERLVVGGAGGNPIGGIQPLAVGRFSPRLDVAGDEQAPSFEVRSGAKPAEPAPVSEVGEDIGGEPVLPDAGRSNQQPLGDMLGSAPHPPG